MSPFLNVAWALLAVIVCGCVCARRQMSSRARVALLLTTLVVCPVITAAQDFAAISRPHNPAATLESFALPVIVFTPGATTLLSWGFVSQHDIASVSATAPDLFDSRSPPAADADFPF